jgi:hypothetical protein
MARLKPAGTAGTVLENQWLAQAQIKHKRGTTRTRRMGAVARRRDDMVGL